MRFIPDDHPLNLNRCPFSFLYDGLSSDCFLSDWLQETETEDSAGKKSVKTIWKDVGTGLEIICLETFYTRFNAVDWVLYFHNKGTGESLLIEDVLPLDIGLCDKFSDKTAYRVLKTNGSDCGVKDFMPALIELTEGQSYVLGSREGLSSNGDFPFIRVDSGAGSFITAIGWSGQWQAVFKCNDSGKLRLSAGMPETRFRLYPGEKVRSPGILLLVGSDDTCHTHNSFRKLLHEHYIPQKRTKSSEAFVFSNSCFTRGGGGGWLNECDQEKQMSLFAGYSRLDIDAFVTDAGWFEGLYPDGVGNWDPRADAYPQGMTSIAHEAKMNGFAYGVWFLPEIVSEAAKKYKTLKREKPDWLLSAPGRPQHGPRCYLDMGNPSVRAYLIEKIESFLQLDGFGYYRQDMYPDCLFDTWRINDKKDRVGVTEMKYIEGLYSFLDDLYSQNPDLILENCASGGRRIDIEMISRFHLHQKSDLFNDNEANQMHLWGLSQYLPNNIIVSTLKSLDDYAFHSALASSLCLGWKTDDPDFDFLRAGHLRKIYDSCCHLLAGQWYPLLPYTESDEDWMAWQYHRPDLDQGMVLIFRRQRSATSRIKLPFCGLKPNLDYEIIPEGLFLSPCAGSELLDGIEITIDKRPGSVLLRYSYSKITNRCLNWKTQS